jgi:hypothetical protein
MAKKIPIIIGSKYGKLTIMEEVGSINKMIYVKVQCDCGTIKNIKVSHLRNGYTVSCGCYQRETATNNKKNYEEKYGRLRIIEEVDRLNPKNRRVLVECDCGKRFEIDLYSLKSGNSKSCGCYKSQRTIENKTIHGDSQRIGKDVEREYIAWKAMKQRCYNSNTKFYYLYGGRGIIVCDRWLEPEGRGYINFLNDMGRKPSTQHSIDRINVDGNYEPSNCRWATPKEQRNNQRVK